MADAVVDHPGQGFGHGQSFQAPAAEFPADAVCRECPADIHVRVAVPHFLFKQVVVLVGMGKRAPEGRQQDALSSRARIRDRAMVVMATMAVAVIMAVIVVVGMAVFSVMGVVVVVVPVFRVEWVKVHGVPLGRLYEPVPQHGESWPQWRRRRRRYVMVR
jgi:hypothetical protein